MEAKQQYIPLRIYLPKKHMYINFTVKPTDKYKYKVTNDKLGIIEYYEQIKQIKEAKDNIITSNTNVVYEINEFFETKIITEEQLKLFENNKLRYNLYIIPYHYNFEYHMDSEQISLHTLFSFCQIINLHKPSIISHYLEPTFEALKNYLPVGSEITSIYMNPNLKYLYDVSPVGHKIFKSGRSIFYVNFKLKDEEKTIGCDINHQLIRDELTFSVDNTWGFGREIKYQDPNKIRLLRSSLCGLLFEKNKWIFFIGTNNIELP